MLLANFVKAEAERVSLNLLAAGEVQEISETPVFVHIKD
jgi:hypothetical protein